MVVVLIAGELSSCIALVGSCSSSDVFFVVRECLSSWVDLGGGSPST